ncbi:MAG TPA: hypothetical protein VIO60_08830 [Rectinemataceae bacterium]
MRRFYARILSNETISPSWKLLGFQWPEDLEPPTPGQFFSYLPRALEPGDSGLLRRPLAFAGFGNAIAFAIYEMKGKGTKALGATDTGEAVDVIAPLGKGFSFPPEDAAAFLVGGGVGIGPMLFLESRLRNAHLHLGFKTASSIPRFSPGIMSMKGADTLALSLARASIATDDGSAGFDGTAIQSLEAEIDEAPEAKRTLFACGPAPMLSALAAFASARRIPAEVSVEQWMACGVGACQGCAVPMRSGGFALACSDGPVFDSALLDWGSWR